MNRSHLITILFFAACGGGGGSLTAGGAIEESWAVACDKIFECQDSFPGTPEDFENAFGASQADCVANLEAEAEADNQGPDDYQASVDEGRIVFNAGDAEVCLDAFGDVSCDDLWSGNFDPPAECDTAFEGQVESGGECTLHEDCAGADAFCDDTTGTCA